MAQLNGILVPRQLLFAAALALIILNSQGQQAGVNDMPTALTSTSTVSGSPTTYLNLVVSSGQASKTTTRLLATTAPPPLVPACSSLYFPNNTDCAGKALFAQYSTCASYYASSTRGSYSEWYLNNIQMPWMVAYYSSQLAVPACLQEPNVSAAIVYSYCTSSAAYWGLGAAEQMFYGFGVNGATKASIAFSFYTVFYWPLAVYILYATLAVLHEVRKANPDNHIIYFFFALSVAQFSGYFFYIYGPFVITLVIFYPFCFVSPTFALNAFTLANALTSLENMYFPTVYIWCYEALLLAAIGFDRVVALYFPVKYSYTFHKAFAKKCLAILTLSFALISVTFTTCVLVASYWSQTVYTGSANSGSTKTEVFAVVIFCVVFLAAPTTLYVAFAFAIVVKQCMRCCHGASDDIVALNASEEARRRAAAVQLSTLALTPVLLNLTVMFFQVCSAVDWFINVIIKGTAETNFNTFFVKDGVKVALPYVLDLSFVAAFILQCTFSKLFRNGAKKFAKKTWFGALCILPLTRRLCGGIIASRFATSMGGGSTIVAPRRTETRGK